MSEPKVLYVQRPVVGGVWDFQPADDLEVLAHIRSRVESGTIKGEYLNFCIIHQGDVRGHHTDECERKPYLVIPVSDGGSET